jgi:multiple sugar transport system permease protein
MLSRRHFPIALLRGAAYVLVTVWSLLPIAFIVSSSFKRQTDIFTYPPRFLFTPTFDNYVTLWTQWDSFFATMGNSLIVALGATLLAGAVSFLAGFAYSRYASRFLAGSAVYMIAIRLLPPIVVTLPLFPAVDYLRLSDTHAVLILLYATFWVSLYTMIVKTFIDEVPNELDEAAMMDGATQLQTLVRVILPLCAQGMVAGAIFVFIYSWNEFLFALIFTTQHAKTAPLLISEMMGAIDGAEWGVLFAGVTLQLLPVVVLVSLAQKHIIAGLTAGAVKG